LDARRRRRKLADATKAEEVVDLTDD